MCLQWKGRYPWRCGDALRGLNQSQLTDFSHPLLGSRGVEGTAASGYEDFGVDVEEGEDFFEVEFLSGVEDGSAFSGLDHNDGGEGLDHVLADEEAVSISHDSKVEFLLEGDAEALVEHGDALLVSEQQNFGDAGAFGDEGVDVGAGDLNHVGVQVLGCGLLDLFDAEIFLCNLSLTVKLMVGMGVGG